MTAYWPQPWVDAEEWPPREETPELLRDAIHAAESPLVLAAMDHAEKEAAWLKPHSQRAYETSRSKHIDRFLKRLAEMQ